MRKETYLCDSCLREFGSQSHINIKNSQVFISHLSQRNEWKSEPIKAVCREYHFCNCSCLHEWLSTKVKEAMSKIYPTLSGGSNE